MRGKIVALSAICISFIVSFIIISRYFGGKENFENFDLGKETKIYYAVDDSSRPIHCARFNKDIYQKILEGWERRGRKNVILVLGNSQTHAINQLKPTDINLSQILQHSDFRDSFDFLTHSMPNANLQEFYFSFQYMAAHFPVKKVIIPVFIDDLRENDIRSIYFSAAIADSFHIHTNTAVAKRINDFVIESRKPQNIADNDADIKALKETVQESAEKSLNSWLHDHVTAWSNRENVRGDIFTSMYLMRNTVLMINPQTKRRLIPTYTEHNMLALKELCTEASKAGVEVYLYVPPLRTDVEPPYFHDEYEGIVNDLRKMSEDIPSVYFKRIDSIVPGKYWGYKDPTAYFRKREYDFMHFQYAGHKILADSLYQFLKNRR